MVCSQQKLSQHCYVDDAHTCPALQDWRVLIDCNALAKMLRNTFVGKQVTDDASQSGPPVLFHWFAHDKHGQLTVGAGHIVGTWMVGREYAAVSLTRWLFEQVRHVLA